MTASRDGSTRAERWARSAEGDPRSTDAARERREQERWDKLYRKLDLLPLVFFLWGLALGLAILLLLFVFGLRGVVPVP